MTRARSLRPKKPSSAQRVEGLLRVVGRSEAGLLDAVLAGADVQHLMEGTPDEPVSDFVERAYSVCLEAHDIWQRCSGAQRTLIRGFSLSLLSLSAEQALALDRSHSQCLKLETERTEAAAQVQQLFERNASLCAQARAVLEKVAGDAAAVREEIALDATFGTSFAVSQVLHRLSQLGRSLLSSADASVRTRARLYGLDVAFLDGLFAAGAELLAVEERAANVAGLSASKARIEQAQIAAYILVHQIVEAFEGAHRIDRTIALIPSGRPKPTPTPQPFKPRAAHGSHRDLPAVREGLDPNKVATSEGPLRVLALETVEKVNPSVRRVVRS
ncbi:MAG TPA: hypothetical protein VH142_23915 [Polyangiaceae bacterium]|jgi:hypothetical protein|nr:hypothetical protein [Polyangiaceae bacterium]